MIAIINLKPKRDLVENIRDESDLFNFICMERIEPEEHFNYLISAENKSVQKKKCITELGIFGISIG